MKDEIVLYQPNEQFQLEVQLKDETVWLTQDQMAQLFDRDRTVIGRHIRNIFSEGELDESLVCAKFALPKKYGRRGGHTQEVEATIYNLDVIISVGYVLKAYRQRFTPSISLRSCPLISTSTMHNMILSKLSNLTVHMIDSCVLTR